MTAGSAWPSFLTLARVSDALGYGDQLRLLDEPVVARRPKPPRLASGWEAAEAAGDASTRARLWQDLVLTELEVAAPGSATGRRDRRGDRQILDRQHP